MSLKSGPLSHYYHSSRGYLIEVQRKDVGRALSLDRLSEVVMQSQFVLHALFATKPNMPPPWAEAPSNDVERDMTFGLAPFHAHHHRHTCGGVLSISRRYLGRSLRRRALNRGRFNSFLQLCLRMEDGVQD